MLSDRFGGRRVFTALMAYSVVPLVLLALFHDSFGTVVVLAFLLGVTGSSFAVGVPFVNRWYAAERQGYALGIYGMGMGGTVIAALTAPRIAKQWSFATPFWVAAALMAVMAVVFWLVARDAPAAADMRRASFVESLAVVWRSSRAGALALFYFLAFGGFVAMFLYLPKLLTGVHELSKTDAGYRAAGFAFVAVIARPVGGWLADRIGADRVLRACFAATIALAAVLALGYEEMVPLAIACLTIAAVLGLGTGAVFKLVAQWFPHDVGVITGFVGAAGGLGGFFPPLVMALVKSATGGYALGFVLMAGVAVGCLFVLMRIDRLTPPRLTVLGPAGTAEAGEARGRRSAGTVR
jgi:NNP family nitrate/nitrite transporter-like MFS transporter